MIADAFCKNSRPGVAVREFFVYFEDNAGVIVNDKGEMQLGSEDVLNSRKKSTRSR